MSTMGIALGMGRRVAESRMTDSCAVTRQGTKTWNESAGEWQFSDVSVYSGPFRLKSSTTGARDVEAGSQLLAVTLLEAHLPVSASGVQAGDRLTVSASATRAEQVGRVFKIVAPFDGTQTTALRFRVEADDARD